MHFETLCREKVEQKLLKKACRSAPFSQVSVQTNNPLFTGMHATFFVSFFKNLAIQSTVCRHSPARFHDRSGSGGSRIHLQSKGEKVKYTCRVCISWSCLVFNFKPEEQESPSTIDVFAIVLYCTAQGYAASNT